MDDGTSTINPGSLDFDLPISTINYEDDEAEAAEALKRKKQIDDDLRNEFDDFIDEEISGDESSNSSDDNSYQTSEHDGTSSMRASFDQPVPSNQNSQYSVSAGHSEFHQLDEQSAITDCDYSQEYAFKSAQHNFTAGDSSEKHNIADNSTQPLQTEGTCPKLYDNRLSSNTEKQFDPALNSVMTNRGNYNPKYKTFATDSNYHHEFMVKGFNSNNSAQLSDHTSDLQEEYAKLKILYDTRGKELELIKREELEYRRSAEQEIKSLSLRLTLLETEKDRLSSSLQDSQKLVADFRQENNVLQGKLTALEIQLSTEKEAKENALRKLESSEVTIQALEKQISELNRSESIARLRDHSDSIMREFNLRHQKEVQTLKENIINLQEKLGSKVQEAENLQYRFSQLQQKYEDFQIEKSEIINKLSANLETSQRQCQQLLESGSISEVSILKLQIQHLEEEKLKIEKQNATLKDEVISLKTELSTSEALHKLTLSTSPAGNHGDKSQNLIGKKTSKSENGSLHNELERALKNLRSQRSLNHSLKKRLEELEKQLPFWEEKAKLFESRFNEYKRKTEELEGKLNEFAPCGSIPFSKHENKVKMLEGEISDLQKKLQDVTDRLKLSSMNEEKLNENIKHFQKNMAEMVKQHAIDKMKAVEECREKCMELHENAIKKLNQDLSASADKDLKTACANYENKIAELQKEIKVLNDGLYDSKSQYVILFEENKALQAKLDGTSKPKELEAVEKNAHMIYEKKLNEIKELMQKQNKVYLESCLKNEVEKAQEEWTKKKMVDIKDFVETTKQHLDEEFQKCLLREQKKLQSQLVAEKEKFTKEYQEKYNNLKKQFEEEKQKISTVFTQSMQSKWKSEMNEIRKNHEKEIESVKQKFEDKILIMENELKELKEHLSSKQHEFVGIQTMKEEFSHQKETWEKEKSEHAHNELLLRERISTAAELEKKLRERVKKYQRHVAVLEKQHQEKISKLQSQISELQKSRIEKQNQLQFTEAKYKQEILELREKIQKNFPPQVNSECQTEDEVVPKKSVIKMQEMFMQCLKKIADEIGNYLFNSRKRTAERLQEALSHYHNLLTSKLFQDMFKDTCSISPSICIPRTSSDAVPSKSRKEKARSPSVTDQNNTKVKTISSSAFDLNFGDGHHLLKEQGTYRNGLTNAINFAGVKSSSESAVRFEDLSFDFVPLKVPDTVFMSKQFTDFSTPEGLFHEDRTNILKHNFPDKLSPI